MRRDRRSAANDYSIVKGLIGDVGDVHHHAQPVHLQHHLLAEIGQAIVMFDLGVGDIARRVGPLVGVGPSQRHVAHTKAIEIVQEM